MYRCARTLLEQQGLLLAREKHANGAQWGREEHNGFGDFVRSRRGIFNFRRASKMGEGSFLHRPASRMGKEVGEVVFTLQEDE